MKSPGVYGTVGKILHWTIAVLIFAILALSFGLAEMPDAEKAREYGNHGLAVTILFALMAVRVVWRLTRPKPAFRDTMPAGRKQAAKIMHILLYVLLFAQMIVGLLLASTVQIDFQPHFLGLNYTEFDLLSDRYYEILHMTHAVLFWLLITAIALHIGAALQHALKREDKVAKRTI